MDKVNEVGEEGGYDVAFNGTAGREKKGRKEKEIRVASLRTT